VLHLIYNCAEKAGSGETRAKHAGMNSAEVQVNRCRIEGEPVITAAGLDLGVEQQVRDATQQAVVVALHAHAHAHVDPVLADG